MNTNNTINQTLVQGEKKAFDPQALINFLESWEAEKAARAIDKAMLFFTLWIIKEGIANNDHSDIYWYLREMRNAILTGSNNIDFE